MINKYNRILLPIFFVLDILVVAMSFILAHVLRFDKGINLDENYTGFLFVVLLSWAISSIVFRTYHVRYAKSFQWHLRSLFFAEMCFIGMCMLYLVLSKGTYVSRLFLVTFFTLQFFLIISVNYVRKKLIYLYRARGYNSKRVVVIGDRERVEEFREWSRKYPEFGYNVKKYLCCDGVYEDYPGLLDEELSKSKYDEVVIISGGKNGIVVEERMQDLVDVAENHGLRVLIAPSVIKNYSGRVEIDSLNGQAVLRVRNEPLRYLHNRMLKRGFDILFSLFILVAFYWWIHIIVAILIKLTSRGPVIFKQKRVGINDKVFTCLKFRTMRHDDHRKEKAENGFDEITGENDSRVTWIGKILRGTNIDELPQFINVLKGDMSVVGPRPHMLKEDHEIRKKIPKYKIRQFVKPGVTGLAAVKGYRGGTKSLKLMKKRTELDIWYIENWSFLLDLKIIGKTVLQMITFRVPNAY